MPWLGMVALALGAGAGWFVGRRREKEVTQARAVPSQLTRDSLFVALQGADESEDVKRDDERLLVDVLRMIADQHGAAVAGLWMPGPGTIDLYPLAWSREPAPALGAREQGLIQWAAENDTLAFDQAEGALGFAAARVGEGGSTGALALVFADGARVTRDALRYWLPRHATRLAAMHELLRYRAEVAKVNMRLRAAMRVAIALQGQRDPIKLEETVTGESLGVVGGEWALLVRWDPKGSIGELRALTHEGLVPPELTAVSLGSLIGDVCADGSPVVYEDARAIMSRAHQLIDGARIPPRTGSLVLVPIRRSREERAIGALAVGHSTVGALTMSEARTMRDVATVAAGALSSAWAVEDARATARRDALTDLFNRRAFEELFTQAVEWTDRSEGSSLALVMVDIDHFKRVNDTYGHDAGDRVLQAVARVLIKDRRATDSVARLGGEELALILPSVTTKGALEVVERLRERIEATRVNTNAGEVRVTASFGVALYASRGGDSATLAERADRALYAAKHGGRNRVELATR